MLLFWKSEFLDGDYKNCPHYARSAGLFVENIHAPFDGINNIWLDNLSGEDMLSELCDCVKFCAENSVPTAVLHLCSSETPPEPNPLGIERLKRLVGLAEDKGVSLALENLRTTRFNSYVQQKIQSKNLGYCYDSGHQLWKTPDRQILEEYGEKLMALHLHDNSGLDDEHLLPFDGAIDWKKIMLQLKKTGYRGALALEVRNTGYERYANDPSAFLAVAFERANALNDLLKPDKRHIVP